MIADWLFGLFKEKTPEVLVLGDDCIKSVSSRLRKIDADRADEFEAALKGGKERIVCWMRDGRIRIEEV